MNVLIIRAMLDSTQHKYTKIEGLVPALGGTEKPYEHVCDVERHQAEKSLSALPTIS